MFYYYYICVLILLVYVFPHAAVEGSDQDISEQVVEMTQAAQVDLCELYCTQPTQPTQQSRFLSSCS